MLSKENAPACNQLLFDNHLWCMDTVQKDHPMPHFFSDILSLNMGGSFHELDSYTKKRRKISRSLLVPEQCCNTHSYSESEYCHVPYAHFGCSGLPCTDMSRAGYQLGRDGPTNVVYITHGKFVERMKVPLLVIECTPESRLSYSYIFGNLHWNSFGVLLRFHHW